MTRSVPFLDLVSQHAEVADDVQADLRTVFDTAGFVGGPHVTAFEKEYAAYVGVSNCVGLANGTDAVEFALRALGIGPGDEVIIPANTFVATAEAVVRAGATCVLVDVTPTSMLMEPSAVADAVSSRTRAIVPVHLYGQMAPMEEIASAAPGIPLVEDAAQSQGATQNGRVSGSIGALAATSFYPGKNLGAAGDAGAITTPDVELADVVRRFGNHGSLVKYQHETVGFNSRLDAVQAVVLRHKLRRLDDWNSQRADAAARYHQLLADLESVTVPATAPGNTHVWHLYVIRVANRDEVVRRLQTDGIGVGLHYPEPVHRTAAFRSLTAGSFPVAEWSAEQLISLPMFPHITEAQQNRVADSLAAALGQ